MSTYEHLRATGTSIGLEINHSESGSRSGWRSPGSQLERELSAALKHLSRFDLDSEIGRNAGAFDSNPPFRTPAGMWSKAANMVQSLASSNHYKRLVLYPTDAETLDTIWELRDVQHLPVPTSVPSAAAFSRLLDEADGLSSASQLDIGDGAASGMKDLGSSTEYSSSETEARVTRFAKPSSTVEQYFCGLDAGLSTRLYARYIRLANMNVMLKASWEIQVKIVDLYEAAQQMLQELQPRQPRQQVRSMDIANFVNHFQGRLREMRTFIDDQMSRLPNDESTGEKVLLKSSMAVFAHLTALKQAYEHRSGTPFHGLIVPQQYTVRSKSKNRRKTVAWSQALTTVISDTIQRDTASTFFDTDGTSAEAPGYTSHLEEQHTSYASARPLNNSVGSSLSSVVSNQSAGFPFEHDDVAIESDGEDDESVRKQMLEVPSLFDVRFHDAESNGVRVTKEWMKSFKSQTQTLLKMLRKKADERIRIAVLDTGIDLHHPDIVNSKDRIIQHQSWVAGDSSMTDTCGHGTHIASIILQMAPWAHLYVARVFKNGNEVSKAATAAVAKAIDHARTKWEVDILSMSFGYQTYRPREIEAALEACHVATPPVLIFAAAANPGARAERPAFPANMSSVFCINSASGDGLPSSFNPPLRRGYDNFTFLGEAISGAWPMTLDPNNVVGSAPQKTLTGTSMATPVAVSIAALVLEFCRQQPLLLSEPTVTRIHTYDGMREVFRETMASSSDRRDMLIQPWGLLDASVRDTLEEARSVAMTKLASAMRKAFGA